MTTEKTVVAAIHNWRDGKKDDLAHRIFKKHDAEHYYQEMTYAPEDNPHNGDREIGYSVDPARVEELRQELWHAGFLVRIGDGVGGGEPAPTIGAAQ